MNWSDKHIWKQNLISSFLCFISCSVAMTLTAIYFMDLSLFLQFIISSLASFAISFLSLALWEIIVQKTDIIEAIKNSSKMSIVSIIIMMSISYLVMLLMPAEHSAHQMMQQMEHSAHHQMQMSEMSEMPMSVNPLHIFVDMLIPMLVGFLFALPYNYYTLFKTGKIC